MVLGPLGCLIAEVQSWADQPLCFAQGPPLPAGSWPLASGTQLQCGHMRHPPKQALRGRRVLASRKGRSQRWASFLLGEVKVRGWHVLPVTLQLSTATPPPAHDIVNTKMFSYQRKLIIKDFYFLSPYYSVQSRLMTPWHTLQNTRWEKVGLQLFIWKWYNV